MTALAARRSSSLDARPLLEFARLRAADEFADCADGRRPESLESLARVLGTSRRQVARWSASGRITVLAADRAAVSLRVHPSSIWPEWFGGS